MSEKEDAEEEYQRRVDHLREVKAAGQRYMATTCDRIGDLNIQLMAFAEAGWHVHSIVPFHLPAHLTTDPQSYFAVIAERKA